MLETSRKLFVHYRGCHKKYRSVAATEKPSSHETILWQIFLYCGVWFDLIFVVVEAGSAGLAYLTYVYVYIYIQLYLLPLYYQILKLSYDSSDNFHGRDNGSICHGRGGRIYRTYGYAPCAHFHSRYGSTLMDPTTSWSRCKLVTVPSLFSLHLQREMIYGETPLALDLKLIYPEIMYHTGFPIVFFFNIKIESPGM